MKSLALCICTYNPELTLLREVFTHSARSEAQALESWAFERLVIDNNSNELIRIEIQKMAEEFNFRYVREDAQGLTFARLRAIAESNADFYAFIDDDNLVDSDFFKEAANIVAEYPKIGCFSGEVVTTSSAYPLKNWQKRFRGLLVHRELPGNQWGNSMFLDNITPCGAGMICNKEAALRYAKFHKDEERPIILDRSGGSLMSGGDNDLAFCAIDAGFGMGVFSSLRVKHLIPAKRFRLLYLLKLCTSISASRVVLEYYWRESSRSAVSLVYNLARRTLAFDFFGVLFAIAELMGFCAGKKYVHVLKKDRGNRVVSES